jgi:hypothetical protein
LRARFDALSNVVLVLAASTIALAVARREFITDRPAPESAALAEPKYHPKWQELLAHGRVIGHERASVRIVEFADLQCPFCREFHQAFLDVQRELARVRYPCSSCISRSQVTSRHVPRREPPNAPGLRGSSLRSCRRLSDSRIPWVSSPGESSRPSRTYRTRSSFNNVRGILFRLGKSKPDWRSVRRWGYGGLRR